MSKRSMLTNFYGQKKLFRLSTATTEKPTIEESTCSSNNVNVSDIPTDTEAALIYLKGKFPQEKFEQLPPIVLIPQIYSIIKNRTSVDKEVRNLQANGRICLFKLGGEESVLVVIFTDDLNAHVRKQCPSKTVIERYLKVLLPDVQDVAIDKSILREKFSFTEHDISDLVAAGLLALRSASSFWFSFPNSGEFVRTYLKGRKSILRTIRKCKFSEILQFELEQRKLEKSARLGMLYHIHDIIGADLVKCVETTSGLLLRYNKK